jgi:hypothetical protein
MENRFPVVRASDHGITATTKKKVTLRVPGSPRGVSVGAPTIRHPPAMKYCERFVRRMPRAAREAQDLTRNNDSGNRDINLE